MRVVAPDPVWPSLFMQLRDQLAVLLPDTRIEHIGSNAIPGIAAKPIVDLLIGVLDTGNWQNAAQVLSAAGWVEEGRRGAHAWLCLPSPSNRAFIAHVVIAGGEVWQKRLTFRDYLRAHPLVAGEYESLKHSLAVRYKDDLTGYTRAKADFVADLLERPWP